MRRKKKKKLLIYAVCSLIVLGGAGAYFGSRYVLARRVDSWRAQGLAQAKAGNHEQAADLLARYLQRRPGDVDAMSAYVDARERAELPNGQHYAETIGALRMLLNRDPTRVADRRHLMELYARLDRRPEALDTANALLAKDPKDLRALEIKADVQSRMRSDIEAHQTTEKWVAADPASLRAHMARLSLRARLGHPATAVVADAQRLREQHPGDPKFELLQGFAYAQTGDDAQAAQWLRAAARHPAPSSEFAKALVTQLDALGLSEDALAVLQELVRGGAGVDVRHALARRLWERGKFDDVVENLRDLDPADPAADPTLVAFKAIALSNLRRAPEADAARAALAARKQAAARAWTLLLRRALDAAPVDDRELADLCRAALLADPQNPYLGYYLGDANACLGEADLAIDAWRRVVTQHPAWNVPSVRLVEALLQKGRPEQALWVASTTARHGSANAASVISLARAWAAGIESGGVAQADELLKLVGEVQRQLPGEDQTLLIQVQVLAQRGNKAEATNVVRAALNRTTPQPAERLLLTLATASRKFGLGVEQECFARSEQLYGLTAPLALERALAEFAAGRPDEGLRHFDAAATTAGKAGDPAWQLARAQYLDVTNSPDARAAWVKVGDAFPHDLAVQNAASAARAVRGDWDFMQRTIDRLKTIGGEKGLAWRLAKARLMVEAARDKADYEQGAVLLNDIIREYPSLPEARVLLARALVQMKRFDGAVEHMSVAAQLDPTSVPIALQLATLLQSRGDFDRVRQELDRITPHLRSAGQRRRAALLLAEQGSSQRAAELLERDEPGGGDARPVGDDLLLAVAYRRNGQLDKAEQVVRKLLDRPNLPTVQFAANLYATLDRRPDAEQALAKLDNVKLDPGIKDMVWGSYYVQVGDMPAAVQRYKAATEQAPANSVAWRILATCQMATGDAAAALATLAQAHAALPADKALAAAHAAADLLRQAAPDESLRPVALTVIRDPLNAEPALDLLRAVTESRGRDDRARLASRLHQLVDRNPGYLPAHVQLVRALWTMGRAGEAITAAQRAMTAFPNDPDPAQLTTQLCAAANPPRWRELETAAAAWRKRSRDTTVGPDLALARAHVAQRQAASAVRQLQPHVAAATATPDKHPDLLLTYAHALADSGKAPAAADLLWPRLADSAPWRLRWIGVASELTDAATAAQWLDRVAAVIPPDAAGERLLLAEAFDRVGHRPAANPQAARRAAELFAQLAANPDAPATVMLAAASHAERTKDVPRAIALYTRAIEKDPNLWVAHNNLAMVLVREGGDAKAAVTAAQNAVTLQPARATVHDTLATAQSKAGDAKAAAESMRAATRLEPEEPKWRVRLANYLNTAGERPEAAKVLESIESDSLPVDRLSNTDQQQLQSLRKTLALSKPR